MDATYAFRQDLLSKLQSGQWRPGDKLPTERAFCAQFHISRTSVRKVLGELKEAGWLHQTVGSGTYVSDRAPWTGPENTCGQMGCATSPAELMQARLSLEPAIVELVIGHATTSDFELMKACCEQAEAALSQETFELWDARFHEAIAQAAHNTLVTRVFQLMSQAPAHGEWGTLKKRSFTPERRQAYQREHRQLLMALQERDLAKAREATLAHLLHVRRNLLGH